MPDPLPDYSNLDLSGEVRQAAERMEARAREPASAEMFARLVAPLLGPGVRAVLEFGCGTAALARRVARAVPQAAVYASDKSAGMIAVAGRLVEAEGLSNLHLRPWDVLDEGAFPFPVAHFDLILSSVVIPYFDDEQTAVLVHRLAARLTPGGALAFLEQDLTTDTINSPRVEMLRGVLTQGLRTPKRALPLRLRPVLRAAGLTVLPRRSFLWTDDSYGPYTRDLLERFADAAVEQGRLQPEESQTWKAELDELARSGDFYYGIVYHLIAGQRPA